MKYHEKKRIASRIWANVNFRGVKKPWMETQCWEWLLYCNKKGYAYLSVRLDESRKVTTFRVHRLVWKIWKGEVPDDMHLDHLCCNPKCVRPSHLEPVTHEENNKRREEHRSLGHV